MQDCRNLPRRTAVLHRCVQKEGDLWRESQQQSSEDKEEARDPDQDVEDFRRIMGNYMSRNLVAPRKTLVPKDDFPIHLNYIDVQRHDNEH